MNILLFIQCFPPLLKYAGGVSKRYLTLTKSLVRQNHNVTIMTPVDVLKCNDVEIMKYVDECKIRIINIEGLLVPTADGTILGANVFSTKTFVRLHQILPNIDISFVDDVFGRSYLHLIFVSHGVKPIYTFHTDITKVKSYKNPLVRIYGDYIHNHFFRRAVVATTTKVFANHEYNRIGTKFNYIWPPIIWSQDFKESVQGDISKFKNEYFPQNYEKTLFTCGRISPEKRYELLIDAIPPNYALVIVGDTRNDEYVLKLNNLIRDRPNIWFSRGMVDSKKLALYYHACDLYVSASNFETCGNALIEAWTCGTPVAVQPEQGHLEWLEPNRNGFAVDYTNTTEATKQLLQTNVELATLEKTTKYFQDFDFDAEIYTRLIEPATKLEYAYWERMLCMYISFVIQICVGVPFQIILYVSGMVEITSYYIEKD